MADKKVFFSKKLPRTKGPYSQAVMHRGMLYLSGQIPIDPETGMLVTGTIEDETNAVLKNIQIIVEEAGSRMENVLKTTCYLADLRDFDRFNNVYKNYFLQHPPARTTIQAAGLPLDVQVEMDAVVSLPRKTPFNRRRKVERGNSHTRRRY
jgi:2-iminobutanoate/2-iminopropanoate deaminase